MKKSTISLVLILISLMSQGQTEVSSNIEQNITWTKSKSPYVITRTTTIDEGVTLTIEPGVVIKNNINHDWYDILNVKGTLIAQGTEQEPIVFTDIKDDEYAGDTNNDGSATTPKNSDWDALNILAESKGTSKLKHCLFRFGGYNYGALDIVSNEPTIENCKFENCKSGIAVSGSCSPVLSNITVESSSSCPFWFSLRSTPSHSNIVFKSCAYNGIGIVNSTYKSENGANLNLKKQACAGIDNIPYIIGGTTTIDEGVTLTIEPGVVIKNNINHDWYDILNVKGTLIAQGTEQEPIVFTDIKDDEYAGDTNNDGSATTPKNSDWDALNILAESKGTSKLKHCLFRFGGYNYGALDIVSNEPTIENCKFENCKSGIAVSGSCSPVLSNITVESSSSCPFWFSLRSTPSHSNIVFKSCAYNGIGIVNSTYKSENGANLNLKKQACAGIDNIPYIIGGTTTIDEGVTLTIEPGVVIKNNINHDWYDILNVKGTLIAQGTEQEPIVFTDIKDDEYAGDTNNDGSATTPKNSDWDALNILAESKGTSKLKHCLFRFGGYNYGALDISGSYPQVVNCYFETCKNAIYLATASDVYINNISVNNSETAINSFLSTSTISIDSSKFTNNETAIFINGGFANIKSCEFSGSSKFDIENQSANNIDATQNWWGIDNMFKILKAADSTNISFVFDKSDDVSKGKVLLNPPLSPPKGIHKISPSIAVYHQEYTDINVMAFPILPESQLKLVNANATILPDSILEQDSIFMQARFSWDNATLGIYDVLIISPDNDTIKLENGFSLQEAELDFNVWNDFEVKAGNRFVSSVAVPTNMSDLFVFVKKGTRIGYSGTWSGKLKITKDGQNKYVTDYRSSDMSYYEKNPESGFYSFEIEATSLQGSGKVLFTDSPPLLQLNQWETGEILRPYGEDWKKIVVPENSDKLTLQTEGYGKWSTIDVYYESITNNKEHWHFKNWGSGYQIKGEIPNPKAGTYYIKYIDSAVLYDDSNDDKETQQREYMIFAGINSTVPPSNQPLSVESLSTYEVGQGEVSIEITGTGFLENDVIKLVKGGNEYIAETFFQDSRNTLATFYLADADTGKYELQVYSMSEQMSVQHGRLVTVNQTKEENGLWVSLFGRDKLRLGRSQKLIVRYGNNSSIDHSYQLLYISLPKESIDSICLSSFILEPSQLTEFRNYNDTTLLLIPFIASHSESSFEIKLKISDKNNHIENFKIEAGFIKIEDTNHLKSLKTQYSPRSLNMEKTIGYSSHGSPGDLEFIKFNLPLTESADINNTPTVHVASNMGEIDPFNTGTKHEYMYELSGPDGTNKMRRIKYSEQEKQDFPDDAESYRNADLTKKELIKKELIKKYGADVTEFIDAGKPLLDWSERYPDDAYLGSASVIEADDPLKNSKLRQLQNQAIQDFQNTNYGKEPKYKYGLRFGDDKNWGTCGDLMADLYSDALGIDLPGFLNIPADMFEQLDREGFAKRANLIDYYYNQLLSAVLLPDYYKLYGRYDLHDLVSKYFGVVTSTTPEDKYGPTGASVDINDSVSINYIDTISVFEYKIDYWNKEDATAPAAIVYIRDTMDVDFDLQTLNFTEVGFLKWKLPLEGGSYFNVNIDCRPDMPYIVNVEGTVDPETREVYWVHTTLDPETMELPEDPMSGYLPPIDSTGYQIGWVNYTIKANPNLPDGTVFTNQAHVNFDGVGKWGPAPKEGPYTNIFDYIPPISYVLDTVTICEIDSVLISWAGYDTGAGLGTYTIYVSDGSGYKVWLENVADTTAWFHGENNKTYKFYSIATDRVGNEEFGKVDYEAIVTFSITGIESINKDKKYNVDIYPNPTQSSVNVKVSGNLMNSYSYKVFNSTGQIISESVSNSNTWRVDMQNLEKGVYFIRINIKDESVVKKVILQ